MWVKLCWCPSHSIRFLFFIHELIKLFPSHAALLSRKAPLPQGWRPALIHLAPGEGGSGLGSPGGGASSRGRTAVNSPPHTLDPSAARGHQSQLYPDSPQGSVPGPGALRGSPDHLSGSLGRPLDVWAAPQISCVPHRSLASRMSFLTVPISVVLSPSTSCLIQMKGITGPPAQSV